MKVSDKKKVVAIIEFIISRIDKNPDDSLSDIVNEALDQWPVIEGFMDSETLKILWEQS